MKFLHVIALLVACLLTSCIDCHEEIWLEADGSGHADISYTLPAAAARFQGGETGVRKQIEKFLSETKEIKSSACEVSTEGDRLKIRVSGAFDSALDLKEISTGGSMDELPSSATNLAGKVEVSVKGRTVDLTRTISPGAALPGAAFMPASAFEGHRLVYVIHLPTAAKESNATRTADDGRTLVWDFPLAKAIRTPVTTRFVAEIPIPRWMLITAAPVAFVVGWLALLGFKQLRKLK
ncbi:MAG: hypothetical protein ABIT37_22280 [Luteolibacter sp.]